MTAPSMPPIASSAPSLLVIWAFPWPCVATWQDKGQSIKTGQEPSRSHQLKAAPPHLARKAECALDHLMAQLWDDVQDNLRTIETVVTISGPGPFTAIRAGVAFAQGLALGWGAKLLMPTWFDLWPERDAARLAVHTGIPLWHTRDLGALSHLDTPSPTGPWIEISQEKFTPDHASDGHVISPHTAHPDTTPGNLALGELAHRLYRWARLSLSQTARD